MKQSMGSVVKKYWLTGVLPAFRDGISPLLAASDISHKPEYSGLCGLTEDKVRAIATEYLGSPVPDKLGLVQQELKRWYNGYQFCSSRGSGQLSTLYNPQHVFNYLRDRHGKNDISSPVEDDSTTHIASVLSAMGASRELNFTDFFLSVLSENLQATIQTGFGAPEVEQIGRRPDITYTILYYFGVLTRSANLTTLKVPNATMSRLVCFMFYIYIPLPCRFNIRRIAHTTSETLHGPYL